MSELESGTAGVMTANGTPVAVHKAKAAAKTAAARKELDHMFKFEKKLCKFMLDRTCVCLCSCLCTMFLLTCIVIGSGLMAFSEPSTFDWAVPNSQIVKQLDAINNARDSIDSATGSADNSVRERSVASLNHNLILLFSDRNEATTSSIFTPASVLTMCELENYMLNDPRYKDFCVLDANDLCATQPRSVLNYFYPGQQVNYSWGYGGWNCSTLPQSTITAGEANLLSALNSSSAEVALDAGYHATKTALAQGFTHTTRSQLQLGAPLPGFTDPEDDDQLDDYKDFMLDVEDKYFDHFGLTYEFFKTAYVDDTYIGDMHVRFFSFSFQQAEFDRMVNGDLLFTIVSMLFVFCYIWWHTSSLWLTATAMAQILMSLPVAFFIYRVIFGIKFYTQLHVLAIFLVLGVGADDVFVFVDAWKQSAGFFNADHERLLFSFHRASRAVFNTSFTTAFAFAATALSPVMPVSSFGIYAATAIILNYLFVCTATPCEVLVWHRRWSKEGKALRQRLESARSQRETARSQRHLVDKSAAPLPEDGAAAAAAPAAAPVDGVIAVQPAPTTAAPDAEAAVALPPGTVTPAAVDTSAEAGDAPQAAVDASTGEAAATGEAADDAAATAAPQPVVDGASAGDAEEDASRAITATPSAVTPTTEAAAGVAATGEVATGAVATTPAEEDSKADADGDADVAVDVMPPREPSMSGVVPGTGAPGNDATTGAGASTALVALGDDEDDEFEPEPEEQLRWSERLFRDYYVPALLYKFKGVKVVSISIILVFFVYFIFSFTWAARLETPTSQEEWFADDHMFTGLQDYMTDTFFAAATGSYVDVEVAWGIEGVDRSDFVIWEPHHNRGKAIYNPNFDLSQADAQQGVLDMCADLRTYPCELPGCAPEVVPRRLVLEGNVDCFLEHFGTWYTAKTNVSSLPTGQTFFDELKLFRAAQPQWASNIGFINGELKYVSITFVSSLLRDQPNGLVRPVYDRIAGFIATKNQDSPATLGPAQQTSEWWSWMRSEKGLVDGMFFGLFLCFPVAFLVLCAATNNVIVALYAVACIAGIVASVLGFGENALGWSLGVAESISAVIVIGFSVDYVVHLGHMYAECKEPSREARFAHSAVTMGVTVIAGAITTFGAGAVMLLCQMVFFTKMATLISMTIFLSFATALGPFMALCAIIGPEGTTGNISVMARALWARIKPKN